MTGALTGVIAQLRLDAVAVAASGALAEAGLEHCLIKGPTTSLWLYDPPRAYRDVDLLVPASTLDHVVAVLVERGVATTVVGRVGEEASHSLVLLAPNGAEIDLHIALPTMAVDRGDPDAVWAALRPHVVDFPLSGHVVPALDHAARCVVLAMHVIASGDSRQTVFEDLRRARQRCTADEWRCARAVAQSLGVASEMSAVLDRLDDTVSATEPLLVTLRLGGASASAIQLASWAHTGWWSWPALLWHELFPSREFMRRRYPELSLGSRRAFVTAYVHRGWNLMRSVPSAVRELRLARRSAR